MLSVGVVTAGISAVWELKKWWGEWLPPPWWALTWLSARERTEPCSDTLSAVSPKTEDGEHSWEKRRPLEAKRRKVHNKLGGGVGELTLWVMGGSTTKGVSSKKEVSSKNPIIKRAKERNATPSMLYLSFLQSFQLVPQHSNHEIESRGVTTLHLQRKYVKNVKS